MAYVGLFMSGRSGRAHDVRPLRRRHPRLGRPGAQRQAGPGRLRRRRAVRRLHLQRRRLVDAVPRDVPIDRTHAGVREPLRRRRARLGRAGPSRPVLRRRPQRKRPVRPVGLEPPGLVRGVPRADDLVGHEPLGKLHRRLGGRVEPRPSRRRSRSPGSRAAPASHTCTCTTRTGSASSTDGPGTGSSRIYYRWIHDYRSGRNW